MSFFHNGPCGRVAIDPKTSESEGALRPRRQPVSEWPGEGSCSSGSDDKAMLMDPFSTSITLLRIICNCMHRRPQQTVPTPEIPKA